MTSDSLYSALYSEASSAAPGSSLAELRKKEIAAAELEARRLSLARRPSVPAIPLPGQSLHGKSYSVGSPTPPPLTRAHTESMLPTASSNSFMGRMIAKHSPTEATHLETGSSGQGSKSRNPVPATPRAMKHPDDNTNIEAIPEIPDNLMMLTSSVYRPNSGFDIPRSSSAPSFDHPPPQPIPDDLPLHPAFTWNIPSSRSSSKTRDRDFSPNGRGTSRERTRVSPRETPTLTLGVNSNFNGSVQPTTTITIPPVLPELQHLASPPPPPPPPSMPHHQAVTGSLSVLSENPIEIESRSSTAPPSGSFTAPILQTTFPEPPPIPHHRRGRSGNENFADKIRSITGRLRSSSRGRHTQSPPQDSSQNPSPYESIPIQAYQALGANANAVTS